MGDRIGAGQVQKQFVEGNDPRGGHRKGGGGYCRRFGACRGEAWDGRSQTIVF